MKKFLVTVLVLLLVVSTFTACTKEGDKTQKENAESGQYVTNDTYSETGMKTVSGGDYVLTEGKTYAFDEYGVGITLSDSMIERRAKEKDLPKDDRQLLVYPSPTSIYVSYTTDNAAKVMPSDEELKKMSKEEKEKVQEEYYNNIVDVFAIIKEYPGEDKVYADEDKEYFNKVEELVKHGEYTYYFAYNDDFSKYTLTDEEKEMLTKFVTEMPYVKDNVCIFTEVEKEEGPFEGTLSSFSGKTISGKDVNQDIFKDYDITMVNIWATWCGYCVKEFPDLQKLYEQLPENVNLIGVCSDASSELEAAQDIIKETGIKFESLVDNDEINSKFIEFCTAFPTTVFLDKNGNVVGKAQVGAPENVVEGYMELIQEALKAVGR